MNSCKYKKRRFELLFWLKKNIRYALKKDWMQTDARNKKKTREHFPCERILCCPVRSWWWQRFCTTRKKERNVCVWLNYLNFILVPCNLKMQWWKTHRPRVSLQWLATAVGWINSTNPRTDPVKCATKKKSQKDKSARKNRQNQRKWPENHLTKGIEIHQTKEKHKKNTIENDEDGKKMNKIHV